MMGGRLVFIVGGGKTGSYLASLLLQSGCSVRVFENRPLALAKVLREVPKECVVLGDGTDPIVLERAGIANAEVLAAVTGDDETNLVAASIAKFEYRVSRVIMRINNPRNAWICTPEMGVDVAINQPDLIASLIVEEMMVGDMLTLVRLRQGAVEIVEERIVPESRAVNVSIGSLGIPSGCNIAAVMRGDEVVIPDGSTVLQAGDEILVVIQREKRVLLQQLLG